MQVNTILYKNEIIKLKDELAKKYYLLLCDEEVTPQDISDAIELDMETYSVSYRFSLEKCVSLMNINPKTYVMVKDVKADKVVGYINTMCVNEGCYDKIRRGEFPDSEIPLKDVLPINGRGVNYVYFASILVKSDHRERGIATVMLKALAAKMKFLFGSEYPVYIVFDDVSEHGIKLCESLNLEKVDVTQRDSVIYEGKLQTKEAFFSFVRKLGGYSDDE